MSTTSGYPVLREILHDHQPTGWAAEFGVATGTSLRIIATHMPVIGFDCFTGLPTDWRAGFTKGMFASDIPHVVGSLIVHGLFADTVPDFPFPPLALVHIDCDLYDSTTTALAGIAPYIGPGTIIVFDEYTGYPGWEDHEARAWDEFTRRHHVHYQTIAAHGEEAAFRIEDLT